MIQKCRVCQKNLDSSYFYYSEGRNNNLQSSCKKCKKNTDKKLSGERKAFVNNIKESSPCTDCKKYYPYYVMDFDHLKDKKAGISRLKQHHRSSLKDLVKEISKCELVCANCHRVRSFKRSALGVTDSTNA